MELKLIRVIKDYIYLLLVAGSVVVLDQITKTLVRSNLAFQETWVPAPWVEPYARIVNWKNTGAAFGMFQNLSMVFTVLAIVVTVVILYYFPRIPSEDRVLRLALGLQLGGALGNLIDRLTQGYVTDFVSVWNFPVFNVADASISLGVAILILEMWVRDRKERQVSSIAEGGLTSEPVSEPVSEESPIE